MEIPYKKTKRGIAVKITVYPKSSQHGISGIAGDVIKIKVNSPPAGGAANKELVEILSDKFRIRKTAIKIIRGHTSRNKVVEIEGIERINSRAD